MANPALFNMVVTAVGSYVPERILTNSDLEQLVDTNHEWIVQRSGIVERRVAREDEYTSDLCIAAIRNMIERYGVTVEDVDYIIVGTTTPDAVFPSVSALVQAAFQIRQCGAIDVSASCAGFVAALQLGHAMIAAGTHRKILVIGAETLTKVTDYADRTTCILFGDGAGAFLLESSSSREGQSSILSMYQQTDGTGGTHVYRKGLAASVHGVPLQGEGKIVQNGREVYKWAVSNVPSGIEKLLSDAGLSKEELDWFVPHSANLRMIESICEKAMIPLEKTLYSLVHYGNTSAATIPLAIDDALQNGKIKAGDTMLLYGFGAGLVQSGLILRWTVG